MAQIRKFSMKEQVYHVIKNRILNSEYPMGAPLNLVQLSKELGTSNTPIRETLALLEAEGLVTSNLNSKVRVVNFTEDSYQDINRAVLIQLLGAYQLCIEKGNLQHLCQILEERFEAQTLLFQEECTTDFINASIEFDKGFIIACQSEKLLEIFDNLSSLLYVVTRMNHQSKKENRKQNIREHSAILDAVKKNDSLLVQKLLYKHYDKHMTDSE